MEIAVVAEHGQEIEWLKAQILEVPDFSFRITATESADALLACFDRDHAPDLVVASLPFPGPRGLDEIQRIQRAFLAPPAVIVVAGRSRERVAVEFMKLGLADYLLREEVKNGALRKAVTAVLRTRRLEGDLWEARRRIRELAFTDALTGLFNRHYFNEALGREYENALRYCYPLSCILLDLDGFKEINDRLGHLAGDRILSQAAAIVRASVRKGDVAARFGGDEFVILLPHTDTAGARTVAERIRAGLCEEEADAVPSDVVVSASFGIAGLGPEQLRSQEALLDQADHALYRAKRRGKNTIVAWADAQAGDEEPLALEEVETYKRTLQRIQLQVKEAYMQLTQSLVKAVESRDPLVVDHAKRVTGLAVAVARELGLSGETLEAVKHAAMLHDIGMIGIPDKILLKRTPLTRRERAVIRRHPVIGVELLQHVSFLERERPMILHHHEWYDGSGYPHGLRGRRIPLGARILAVADAYAAMRGERTHRPARGEDEALEEILRNKGIQFDPEVADALVRVLRREAVPAPADS